MRMADNLLPDPPSGGLHFSRREAAGALGDLGTFIPLLVGMVTLCGLQLTPALLFAGLMNVITGLRFRIPMTIQPMKAIAAVAIAERLSEADIVAGGIITGAVILALGLFRSVDKLAALIPLSIVRGLQLALGMKLAFDGFWMVVGNGSVFGYDSVAMGVLCLAVALLLGKSSRFPAALVVFVIGLVSLAAAGLHGSVPASPRLLWHLPQLWDRGPWLTGFWRCAVPQVPLTLLNSVLAVCALSANLFPARPASPRKVAVSVGLMNLLCCPWGAMPMCHGAGGLASQYRFGARSGGSLVILGAAMIALALAVWRLAASLAGALSSGCTRGAVGAWRLRVGPCLLATRLHGKISPACWLPAPRVSRRIWPWDSSQAVSCAACVPLCRMPMSVLSNRAHATTGNLKMASQRYCENVMVCPAKCAGIVLAGGQSRRMGSSKALLPFGPELMLQRVVRIVGEVVQPVVVAAQVGQELPALPQSITVVCDRRPNHGPLEGLAVALAALQGRANATFVTGCDTPLLQPRFVRRMNELLGDFDAVVPCIDGVDQPLLAVYRTSILPHVEQLAGADSRLIALFNRLNIRRVAADLLTDVDPHGDLSIRVNTPADYRLSLARAGLAASAKSVSVKFTGGVTWREDPRKSPGR